MKEELQNIIRMPLEDVMHDSFMPYAEYVILERAIPRVEDGLKPVQRHIIYAMHEMQILPSGGHKKCARIVGETMGKYHPHGDSSIYEALARMAQDFSMSIPLIDGQGNFGSIDGDGPAAMRYTEAKMAPITLELVRDLNKDTVPFQLNFDDSLQEPSVMPSRFPNLLVNGATGIAVGLATNIPPHNLREVIDGVVARIQNPDISLSKMMKYIKGPDFPTGGVLLAGEELKTAYETGRGRIAIRAKVNIEKGRGGRTQIVITELPYEVRESAMLRKIQALRVSRKEMFAGIYDVRSETDRTGIRAVIELRNGVDVSKVLDCLYKYSDLQISYGINMVAIAEGQPRQLGLLEIIDYYINFQREVLTNRLQYDKEAAEERAHKLEGLRTAVLNIDLVIKIIRGSDSVKEARLSLMKELQITGVQAQAILDLRLARLTKLEVITIEQEYAEVTALLKEINAILRSKKKLDELFISELEEISKKYGHKRRTPLSSENSEIIIDEEHFKPVKECVIILTRNGNLKRLSKRAFARGIESGEPEYKNRPAKVIETTNADTLWLFTTKGNLYTLAAEEIKEGRYKDAGSPLNTILAGLEKGEAVCSLLLPEKEGQLLVVTKEGKVKLTDLTAFQTKRGKILASGLAESDSIIYAAPTDHSKPNLLLVTKGGMSIVFSKDEISVQGRSAKGIGGIGLAKDDVVLCAAEMHGEGSIVVFSNEGFAKQTKASEYEPQGRNGRGAKCFAFAKNGSNGDHIAGAFFIEAPVNFEASSDLEHVYTLTSAMIPMEARNHGGIQVIPIMHGESITHLTIT
ncbi:MAG: DNA gyrase/topoisomerase IV subunit A [Christensenellaceae bacterium]|jgi:DNA gyrase subunit A